MVGGGLVTAPLPRRKQLAILRMYFEGVSYDQIAQHAGVAKGSVEEVVRRLKAGEYEEFSDVRDIVDTLRDIAVYVRKHFSGDLARCHIGSVAWVGLNRLGVDPAKVPEWARMCEDLAAPDVPVREFTEIAMWAWRLQEELGVRLPDLPQHLESLRGEVTSLRAEKDTLASEALAAKATLASLREEVGLLQDVKGLRSAKKDEESRFTVAQSRTQAALAAAQITSEGLEQFRVFAGTAKAKGVPLDGGLFDVLLTLVASLGPNGIREADTLRRLLAKEKMNAADGAALLTGLWGLGFTLSRAGEVARALGKEGSFADALNHLVALLRQYGSLKTAVADATRRRDELSRQEAAQRAESENLGRYLGKVRNDLAEVTRQAKQASDERERIRAAAQKIVTDRDAQLQRRTEEWHRIEGMREAWFDELADRFTEEDYARLGARMKKQRSPFPGPLNPDGLQNARLVWTLMGGQSVTLQRQRRAPDGSALRGVDGAEVYATETVTLSRAQKLRFRQLLQQASEDGEGPLHALIRICACPPKAPPQPVGESPEQSMDRHVEAWLRLGAACDILRMIGRIFEGGVGHSTSLDAKAEPEKARPDELEQGFREFLDTLDNTEPQVRLGWIQAASEAGTLDESWTRFFLARYGWLPSGRNVRARGSVSHERRSPTRPSRKQRSTREGARPKGRIVPDSRKDAAHAVGSRGRRGRV